MPRPLSLLIGVVSENEEVISNSTHGLLDSAQDVLDQSLTQLSDCIQCALNINRATDVEQSLLELAVRLHNDIKAANFLIYKGMILSCAMMLRDVIEIHVLADYLYHHPEKSKDWRLAKTSKERLCFHFSSVVRSIENGEEAKSTWVLLSSYLHPNRTASATFSRVRQSFGYNLYLGGYYDPGPAAALFSIMVWACFGFIEDYIAWIGKRASLPMSHHKALQELHKNIQNRLDVLQYKAKAQQQTIDQKIKETRLSRNEVIGLLHRQDSQDN